jgi:cyclic pyranopterin phosphate synthase
MSLVMRPITDSFGRVHNYLRLSLTERCNLRCQYCMPATGVPNLAPSAECLTASEIAALAEHLVRQRGIRKLRLTGGEPLVRKDVEQVLDALAPLSAASSTNAAVGTGSGGSPVVALSMTTNAVLLERHLPTLQRCGMRSVNISLDTLRPERFTILTRRSGEIFLPRVLRAIRRAVQAGLDVKVNCVVMRGINDDELLDFCEYFASMETVLRPGRLQAVRFIEFMPFSGNGWESNRFVPYAEMLQRLRGRFEPESREQVQRSLDPHDTTKYWAYRGDGDSALRVGFITSMSNHFCAGCNRLRVTATGHLRTCLFGRTEYGLRHLIQRGDWQELDAVIDAAVARKAFAHGGVRDPLRDLPRRTENDRPMTAIGG